MTGGTYVVKDSEIQYRTRESTFGKIGWFNTSKVILLR